MKNEWKLMMTSLLRRLGLSKAPRQVLVCIVAGALVLTGLCLWRFWPQGNENDTDDFQISQETSLENDYQETGSPSSTITVDVEGEVRSPGMYELQDGARVGDAVEMAGGLTKKASRATVNLAEKLQDGQQIVVKAKESGSTGVRAEEDSGGTTASGADQGLVNINTATATELQSLSGIGESISQRIVEYRKANGIFGSVDELTNVSGIGEARLASIRDKICV